MATFVAKNRWCRGKEFRKGTTTNKDITIPVGIPNANPSRSPNFIVLLFSVPRQLRSVSLSPLHSNC